MLETVERAFAPELLSVSHRAGRLTDFTWAIFSIGEAVPVKVISEQFPDAEDLVSVLAKSGVLRYALGGFINRDQKKLSLSVQLSEPLLTLSRTGMKRKDFEAVLYREFGGRLAPHCRTALTEPLSAMLTSVIFYASPEKPVFSSMVVKRAAKVCLMTHSDCQDMLDFYLHRFLGLVSMESGSLVNLSVRSRQRAMAHARIWEMYVKEHEEKPKAQIPVQVKLQAQAQRPLPTPMSDQERKVRSYFPWIKL
jgi:hypothetical protein